MWRQFHLDVCALAELALHNEFAAVGLSHEAADLLAAGGFGRHSLYLTIADGGEDMQTGMDRLVAALEAGAPAGLAWWYRPMPDEHHHTIYNPATLDALRLVFAPEETG